MSSSQLSRLAAGASMCCVLLCAAAPALACTTFFMHQDAPIMGKSYDYHIGYGLVVVNKRGAAKKAMVTPGLPDEPAEWVSKYASVTFNQYGREMPSSGINEAGLALELMWLDATVYPEPDDRPVVNELQWIQYALDNYATVDEVAEGMAALRVADAHSTIHYLACDKTEACAAFEYLAGQLVVTTDADMVVKTLANNTYAESAAFLAEHVGFGGDKPIPQGTSSLERFVRASSLALAEQTEPAPTSAFSILTSVKQDSASSKSQWNFVYLLEDGRVHFRTYDNPGIKYVDIAAFPPDCTSDVMILDIQDTHVGDVSQYFVPYTMEANKALLEKSLADIMDQLPPFALAFLAAYPDSVECTIEPPPVETVSAETATADAASAELAYTDAAGQDLISQDMSRADTAAVEEQTADAVQTDSAAPGGDATPDGGSAGSGGAGDSGCAVAAFRDAPTFGVCLIAAACCSMALYRRRSRTPAR